MLIARVIGTVVAPVQHPAYDGQKLLLIRPESPEGETAGATLLAIDRAQAGVGDRVLVVDEGSSARFLLEDDLAPVKTTIVGVIDEIELRGQRIYLAGEDR